MDEFEQLLNQNKLAFERFVKFKISNLSDAEDILQDVYFTAYSLYGRGLCRYGCIALAWKKVFENRRRQKPCGALVRVDYRAYTYKRPLG